MATGGRQKPGKVCPQKADAPCSGQKRPMCKRRCLLRTRWRSRADSLALKRSWRSGRTFAWDFSRSNPPGFFLHVQQCGKENEANYLPPRLILRLTIGIIESWRVIPFGLQMFPGSVVLLRGTWRAKKYPSCDWLCVKVAPSGDGSKPMITSYCIVLYITIFGGITINQLWLRFPSGYPGFWHQTLKQRWPLLTHANKASN